MSFLCVYTFCHNCVSNIEQVGLKCIIKQKLYAKKKKKKTKQERVRIADMKVGCGPVLDPWAVFRLCYCIGICCR